MTVVDELMMTEKEFIEAAITAIDDINESLAACEQLAREISEAKKGTYELESIGDLFESLCRLQETAQRVSTHAGRALEVNRGRREFVALSSGRALELGYSAGSVKWDTPRLKPVVIQALLDEMSDEEGNLDVDPEDLLEAAFDMVGIGYWRTQALEPLDIDSKDYTTKRPRKFRPKVHE